MTGSAVWAAWVLALAFAVMTHAVGAQAPAANVVKLVEAGRKAIEAMRAALANIIPGKASLA